MDIEKQLELVEKVLHKMRENLKKNVIKHLEEDDSYLTMICAEDLHLNDKALDDVEHASDIGYNEDSVWNYFREDPLNYIATDVYAKVCHHGGDKNTFYQVNKENGFICTQTEVKEMLQELKEVYERYWGKGSLDKD